MKTLITIGAAILLCAGCASGGGTDTSTSPGSPAPTDAPAPTTSANGAADGGCARATVDGTTENAQLQRLATDIYESLTCGTGATLADQLEAAAKKAEPELTAAKIKSNLTSADVGSTLALTSGSSGCQIMVVDSVDSKSLTCLDL